ncbi:protein-S-isoprenylcysteine O-methyltransferase Ste14 [Agromyces cerinus]|uniref:methyltransferase family protein n=1 Tax=Agromyces cerinus TaxID=33878 RepID=UPI00195D4CEA|nr:isoprenylcysteine carboxylmethyltransferase family protein [Agromyces cerinus]MBM7832490.1 protein-S-isoprenylcysteine O-methyltransferase Ste14 [Agromyces cerinus]
MRWGRRYFAVQAIAGAVWWVAVFLSPAVREATLGGLDPVVVALLDVPLFVGASAAAAFGLRFAAVVATGWTIAVTVALAGYATLTSEAGWGVLFMAAAAGASVLALCLLILGRVPTEWILVGPFAFAPADARGGVAVHAARTAAQIVVFWGLFLVVGPLVIDFLEQRWGLGAGFPPFIRIAGLVVLVIASALGIWSAAAMSTRGDGTPLPAAMPNRLVIAGPYRYVRNPMALSGIVQGVAVGLILSSWLVVVYAILGSLVWNYAVRPHEESDLEARFGDEFRGYRAAVRCWWPRITGVRMASTADTG